MDKKMLAGLIAVTMIAGTNAYAQESADTPPAAVTSVELSAPAQLAPAVIANQAALQGTGRMATDTAIRGITVEAIAITVAFAAVAVGIVHGRDDADAPPTHAPVHHAN